MWALRENIEFGCVTGEVYRHFSDLSVPSREEIFKKVIYIYIYIYIYILYSNLYILYIYI